MARSRICPDASRSLKTDIPHEPIVVLKEGAKRQRAHNLADAIVI